MLDHLMRQIPSGGEMKEYGEHQGLASSSILGAVVGVYRIAGEARHLEYARGIAGSGCSLKHNIFRAAAAGVPPAEIGNGKAYEMTSCFEGLLELYRDSGKQERLSCALDYFRDLVRYELFVTGAGGLKDLFGEFWDNGARKQMQSHADTALGETCVTTTVLRMGYHLLRLTGDPAIADVMENMLYNGVLGAMKFDGSWWMHRNPTPLAGSSFKRPAGDQIRGYGEDCCLAQGPEALGTGASSAVMLRSDGGIAIHLYEPLTLQTTIRNTPVTLHISGNYPNDGSITVELVPARPLEFPLSLRIPAWCENAVLEIGSERYSPASGRSAELRRLWKPGDRIHLTLPMPVRRIPSPDGSARFALKRGPLLLVQDSRIGDVNTPFALPDGEPECVSHPEIDALFRWPDGRCLCDYASAGNLFKEDNTLCVWLPEA